MESVDSVELAEPAESEFDEAATVVSGDDFDEQPVTNTEVPVTAKRLRIAEAMDRRIMLGLTFS